MVGEKHRTELDEIPDFEVEFVDESMPFDEIKTIIRCCLLYTSDAADE